MRFYIKITCAAHGRLVKSASDQLRMIPATGGRHELDLADTWCPVSSVETGVEHKYTITTETAEG